MLQNYIKIAWRSILKFKGYTLINITGLALGLTSGILVMMYVLDEMSFDQFHTNLSRIYRVETRFFNPASGGAEGGFDANGWPVGNVLRTTFPEVESVLYTRNASAFTVYRDGRRIEQKIHFASPELFSMFSFPLVKGNPETALAQPFSIVISESMAKKYFPDTEALNATLVLGDSNNFVVTGIMEDLPRNSHITADMFMSFSTYQKFDRGFSFDDGWGNMNMRNYILLKEGTDAALVKEKAKNLYAERAGAMLKDWGVKAEVYLQPLSNLYLTSEYNGMGPLGSIDRIYLLTGVSIFVILLACINFINIATARGVYRAKEVGLRKVAGSTRRGLITQFISESFVLTALSFLVALAFMGLLMPHFNELLGKQYTLLTLTSTKVLAGSTVLILFVSILAGYYPSIVLSSMRPVEVLKGKNMSGGSGVGLRRTLVIFQFAISAALVTGTLVVIDQLSFMQKRDLGFAKDEILVVRTAGLLREDQQKQETFRNQLTSLSSVTEATFCNSLPGNTGWVGQIAYPEGKSGDEAVSVEYMAVDEDYISALGLTVIAGNNFNPGNSRDLAEGLILNQTAVALFGWTSAEDAIGKNITSPSGYPQGKVIGVVKDYHQLGLQEKIGPMVMDYNPQASNMYAVRFKASNTAALLEDLKKLWSTNFDGYDFDYFFLNEDFARQYQSEQRVAKVLAIFSIVTIVIALIGLLGLVSFMVSAKKKEIGIRKVLGASVISVMRHLSREYVVLLLVANAVAFPCVWYFANQWLQGFAHRTSFNFLLFGYTFLAAILLTAITISVQTIRAATADPAEALRNE